MNVHRALGFTAACLILSSLPIAAKEVAPGVSVTTATAVAVSRSLRELAAEEALHPTPAPGEVREVENSSVPHPASSTVAEHPSGPSPILQTSFPDQVEGHATNPLVTFEGIGVAGLVPPDTNGAVGPNHYVQTVNARVGVWNKSGGVVVAPMNINSLFSGLPVGDACRTSNSGDPVVLYDQLADRWLITQFAVPSGNYRECLAVSQTGDPAGSYWLYSFPYSATILDDYPHFGLWPDGYYMTVHQFDEANGGAWHGEGIVVFERSQMLVGGTAQAIKFDTGAVTLNYGGDLAASLDGNTLPAAGAPNHVFEWDEAGWIGDANDTLRVWNAHVDWVTPANSTYGANANFDANNLLTTATAVVMACSSRSCIPQPGTGNGLDAISDGRLMYRVGQRLFGDHDSVVLNNTVDACAGGCGNGQGAPRWIELRGVAAGSPSIYQQGIFAPDATHRWMASVGMDQTGNIAMGYSRSNATTVFPTISYTARNAADSLGVMTLGEHDLQTGAGSQTGGSNRWGDYSLLTVDPVDQCTFWYTNEYYVSTSNSTWHTRIGSFQVFPCGVGNLIFADDFESGDTSRWSFTQN